MNYSHKASHFAYKGRSTYTCTYWKFCFYTLYSFYDVRSFSHKVIFPYQRKRTPLFFHNTESKLHLRAFKWVVKPFELSTANSIGEWVRWTTIVDAVEIRVVAIYCTTSAFELQSKVRIGTFIVLTIFGRKLHPTRNISESEKKITDINCMSHPLS